MWQHPLKWYFLFNWLIANWEISSIFNALLICNCKHTIQENLRNNRFKIKSIYTIQHKARTKKQTKITNMIKIIYMTLNTLHCSVLNIFPYVWHEKANVLSPILNSLIWCGTISRQWLISDWIWHSTYLDVGHCFFIPTFPMAFGSSHIQQ